MDLRVVKTKKGIRDAFFELRRTKPLERIRVKDICDAAMINKTTFYKYYLDVFDLSEQLENRYLEQYESSFENADCLFTNPEAFVRGLPSRHPSGAYPELQLLFRGRENVLIDKLKRWVFSLYETADMSLDERVALSFVINGAVMSVQQFADDPSVSDSELMAAIIRTIAKISE